MDACNPYGIFGFGDRTLPDCPLGLPVEKRYVAGVDPFVQETLESGDRALLDTTIRGLAEYLRVAGAGDPLFDPRVRAPGSASAAYFDSLSTRLGDLQEIARRFDAGQSAAQVASVNPELLAAIECTGSGPLNDLCRQTVLACGIDEACRAQYRANLTGLAQAQGSRTMGILDAILGGLNTVGSAVGSSLPVILQTLPALAQAGVIRGDVGAFFTGGSMADAMGSNSTMSPVGSGLPANFAALLPALGGLAGTVMRNPAAAGAAGAIAGDLAIDALQSLFGGGSSCGGARPAVRADSLFRTNACGKASLASRTQVIGPDGAIYVVQSLGRATRGSRERSVLKRLARDNGVRIAARGSSPRRRRPR